MGEDIKSPGADDANDKTVIDPDSPVWRMRRGGAVPKSPDRAKPPDPQAGLPNDATRHSGSQRASALALRVGYRLLEYRIDAVLGQGGFGITYLATDVNLNAKVAIKEYLPEEVAGRGADDSVSAKNPDCREIYEHGLENFLIEARTLATFRHRNIVRVVRFFEANHTAYMVLEYERGRSLRAWWKDHGNAGERELLTLFLPLLDGLGAVHDAGYLHRDIKPDNIYVRDDDGSMVLLDFGSARQTKQVSAADSSVTHGYAPIEQYYAGEQGPWTDIYAVGATLYWMITGRKPREAPDRMTAVDPLTPAAEAGKGRYSDEFLKAVDWALKPEAQDRPRDMPHFLEALYAAHASTLGLQHALRAGDVASTGTEGWMPALKSPAMLKSRLLQAWRALARPSSWPLAAKMMLAMVATALAPMTITAYYNLDGSVERVRQGELRNLEQLCASIAGRVSQLIGDSGNLALYLAKDRDFIKFVAQPREEDKAPLKAKLEDLVKANPDVQLAMIFDRNGTAVISSDPEVMGRNFRFREYFQSAMKGRPYISGIVVGAVAGATGVFFSNPVHDARGKAVGAVVLRIKGSSIDAILDAAQRGAERIPFLIDGDGIIIHHPDRKLLYKSLTPLAATQLERIRADQRFRGARIDDLNMPKLAQVMVNSGQTGSISYFSTISGTEEIAGYAPVRGQNWTVGVTESREYFAAPLDRLFRRVLYSVGVVGAVFLVLALLFARTIVRPIEELTRAAHALKAGDYDKAAVAVKANDEVGQLARTFNVMIDVLRQRERERGALGRRGGTRQS